MLIRECVEKMKQAAAPEMAASEGRVRNEALRGIASALRREAETVFAANARDLEAFDAAGGAPALRKRLLFNKAKLGDCVAGLLQLAELPDPLGRVTLERELDEGLLLSRISCPIGVIGVIFEARPDALVQISSLCLKSGNCAVLKGGKETANTNRALFEVIYEAALAAGLPEGCLALAEQHSEIDELLTCDREVDLIIPRGSNAFVRYIMDHTRIPVMGHADGICHIYVDKDADQDKAIRVILDAKTQYTAACNAVETVLTDRAIAGEFLPKLKAAFDGAGVKMRGTAEVSAIVPCEVMGEEDFAAEYLDLIASVKLLDGVEEAVRHIN
nr:glutamate-5-semialdehyde dehydrogenase [Lachnospiraceae bacterium]